MFFELRPRSFSDSETFVFLCVFCWTRAELENSLRVEAALICLSTRAGLLWCSWRHKQENTEGKPNILEFAFTKYPHLVKDNLAELIVVMEQDGGEIYSFILSTLSSLSSPKVWPQKRKTDSLSSCDISSALCVSVHQVTMRWRGTQINIWPPRTCGSSGTTRSLRRATWASALVPVHRGKRRQKSINIAFWQQLCNETAVRTEDIVSDVLWMHVRCVNRPGHTRI